MTPTPAIAPDSISLRVWKLLWPLRAWLHEGLDVGNYFPNFTLNDEAGRGYSALKADVFRALWQP